MTFICCNYLKLLFIVEAIFFFVFFFLLITLFQVSFSLPSKGLLLRFIFPIFLSEWNIIYSRNDY